MEAPTLINELAQRILRDEAVTDEELAAAIQAMRSQRVGATEQAKKKEEKASAGLEDFLSSLPDIEEK
jgi:hypothetical protein